ncbi:rhoptry protein, putative [Perkinsus marinus ATCC 50983]|uniref:Rhoptry protein, putative n=1 Tax=Perkinsus marinus (strain ATCC 50983 / TXsc) TaxID=423536 RepID=C5KHH2_PERM5|nr:rhoptry protein, putative [Perkinsus marinus ATCC 50983]EER16034.1 rhoptry protein, putative [Perkinsus marinus ATCC 50983]|eukprot:XP_002784238.1 rhoptry protein, putative [Perkinsus marinus ATCC 50983]
MSLPSDSEASFDEGKEPQQLQVHQQHQGGPASVEEIQAFETSAYEALERDFQRVVAELLEDDTLEDFKEQYERLHNTLKQSHDSEKLLISKCREISKEIVGHAQSVQRALSQSQEDQAAIKALRKEIDRAWKRIEDSRDKEIVTKALIEDLTAEVANVSTLVEQSEEKAAADEAEEESLIDQKLELVSQKEILAADIKQLQTETSRLERARRILKADCDKKEEDHAAFEKMLSECLVKVDDNISKRKQLDEDLRRHRRTLGDIGNESMETLEKISEVQETHKKVLRDLKVCSREIAHQKTIQKGLQEEVKRIRDQSASEVKRRQRIEMEIDELTEQLEKQKKRVKEAERAREKTEDIYRELSADKEKGDEERAELLKENKAATKMVEELADKVDKVRRKEEADAKVLSDLTRASELLYKAMQKAGDRKGIEIALVKENEQRSNNLLRELQQWRQAKAESKEEVHELLAQRDRFIRQLKEANDRKSLTRRYLGVLKTIRARDRNLASLKEEIIAARTEYMQQKNEFEAVRADRNLYCKNLFDAHKEIDDIKRKFASLESRTEQLREEVGEKDQELIQKHLMTQEKTQTVERLKGSLEKAKKRLRNLGSVADVYREEMAKIEKARTVTLEEIHKHKMSSIRVAGDKKVLCASLGRKKDDQDNVREKISLCESALVDGEDRYREICEEVKQKKEELNKLQAQLAGLRTRIGNKDEYKHEVYQLQQQLLAERAKAEALTKELGHHMNLHRWRNLEESNPELFKKLEKVHSLQRRLISRSEEVVGKREAVKKEEEEIKKLERRLERIPGPELQEQLRIHEEHLRERNDQLATMNAELADYKQIIDEYQAEIGRLKKERQEIMRKYYEQKKQSSQKEAPRGKTEKSSAGQKKMATGQFMPSMSRYIGGGYCLTPP